EHQEITVGRADVAAALEQVIYHVERPILRAAPAPLFLLSGLVQRAGIKVVLTGEGADEVLAGYDIFREAKVRRFMARQPGGTFRPRLLDRLYPWLSRGPKQARGMSPGFFGMDLDPSAPDFSHRPRFRAAAALKRLFAKELAAELRGRSAEGELVATLPPA